MDVRPPGVEALQPGPGGPVVWGTLLGGGPATMDRASCPELADGASLGEP